MFVFETPIVRMCVHQILNKPTLNRPEKLNWSENGIQDLLCESNYIDMDNKIQVDVKDLNVVQLNIRGINLKISELKYLIEYSLYSSPPPPI